jgi:Hemerythrin HHE cation binding domain
MANKPAESSASRAESLLDEHRSLHELLDRVDSTLAALKSGAATVLSDLSSHLGELGPRLEAHFAHEEEGGLFEEISETWPETAFQCERLLGEHRALLARIAELRADCAAGPAATRGPGGLADRGLSLLRDLAHHEERENELLVRSLDGAVAAQD